MGKQQSSHAMSLKQENMKKRLKEDSSTDQWDGSSEQHEVSCSISCSIEQVVGSILLDRATMSKSLFCTSIREVFWGFLTS